MRDDAEQLPADDAQEILVDPVALETAKARIEARGGPARTMTVMGYPAPVFNELLERLANRSNTGKDTMEWLMGECLQRGLDAPSERAFYYFAASVREEYEMARLVNANRQSQDVVRALTGDHPTAMQDALNVRLTERLTEMLMRLPANAGAKEFMAIVEGTKAVMAGALGRERLTAAIKASEARIEALVKLNAERDRAIALKDQKLLEMKREFEAKAAAAVKAAEGAVKAGGASGADVVATIKKALGIVGKPEGGGA